MKINLYLNFFKTYFLEGSGKSKKEAKLSCSKEAIEQLFPEQQFKLGWYAIWDLKGKDNGRQIDVHLQ